MAAFVRCAMFLIVCALVFSVTASVSRATTENTSPSLNLTEQEKTWIAEHPVIRLAPDPAFPPLEFFDQKGRYTGFVADYIKLIGERTGLKFDVIRLKNWEEVVEKIKAKEVDMLGANVQDESNTTYLNFTENYFRFPSVIFTRSDAKGMDSLDQLEGRRVAVVSDYPEEATLRKDHPGIDLVTVPDTGAGLSRVASGEVDAAVLYLPTASYLIETEGFTNLRIAGKTKMFVEDGIAVRKDWPQLVGILQKGLDSITESERRDIRRRWIAMRAEKPSGPKIDLTPEEKAWIADNPVISVAATSDWPPFEFIEDDGVYKGISADMLSLAADRAGLKVKVVSEPWHKLLEKLKTGELDVTPGLQKSPDREVFLDFTKTIFESPHAIIARKDRADISSFDSLLDKVVAVEKGYFLHEFFERNHPKLKLLIVSGTLEALMSVSEGRADAYVGSDVVANYLIEKSFLTKLQVGLFIPGKPLRLSMGIPKSRKPLRDILQKALGTITAKERRDILDRYVRLGIQTKTDSATVVPLTPEEKAWLRSHKTVRIGSDIAYPPFEFRDDNGVYQGMSSDYISLINDLLGIEMKVVPGLNWSEVIAGVKTDKVDVLSVVASTPERQKFMHFTKPYITLPIIIMMRKDQPAVNSLADFSGKTVAMIKDYFYVDEVTRNYPDIKPLFVSTPLDALNAVAFGKADGVVVNLGVGAYFAQKHALLNLQVASEAGVAAGNMSFGVRKDWPVFAGILEKALNAIPASTHQEILNRWVSVKVSEQNEKEAVTIDLTPEEKAWITKHKSVLVGGETNWPPFNFVDANGNFIGIVSDYLELMSERTGLKVDLFTGVSYGKLHEMFANKELDVLPAVYYEKEREAYGLFTPAYANLKEFVYVRDDKNIHNIEQLYGKSMAIPKGYATIEIMKEKYPQIKIVETESILESLEMVISGQVDATMDAQSVVQYQIKENLLSGLHSFPSVLENNPLYMIVDRNKPLLHSIFSKALSSITREEKSLILSKWLGQELVQSEPEISPDEMLEIVYLFIGAALLILIVMLASMKWRMTVKQKIVIYVVLPTFLVVTLSLGYANWQSAKYASTEVKSRISDLSLNYAHMVDAQLREIALVASTTADILSSSSSLSEEDYYNILKKNVASSRSIYGAAIAFEPGVFSGRERFSPYVYRNGSEFKAMDIAKSYDYLAPDMEWYVAPRDSGRSLWTDPYFDEGAGNIYMVTFSVPFERDGRVIGVTTVDVDLSALNRFAGIERIDENDFIILSKSGKLVFHDGRKLIGKPLSASEDELSTEKAEEMAAMFTSGSSGIMDVKFSNGLDYWVTYAPISSADWSFSARFSKEEALDEVTQQATLQLALLILALALSSMAALLFAGRITGPLSRLSSAVKEISEGNLDVKILHEGKDEVGQLAEAFQAMTQNLVSREQALQKLNAELEQRVEERTAKLSASEENLFRVFESTPVPLAIVRFEDGSVLRSNQAMKDFHQLTSEQMASASAIDAYVDLEEREAFIEKYKNQGHIESDEVTFKRLGTGEERTCLISMHSINYYDERVVLISQIDITEMQEAAEDLQKKEAQFRTLVENIPGTTYRCLLDENWTMLFISNEIEHLSGYPASDFIGEKPARTFADIMHPDDIEPIWENANRAIREQKPYSNEYRVIDREGETHYVYAKGQAVYDQDGSPLYLDGTIFDFTERKMAEEALAEAEERSRLLLESVGEGIFGVDVNGLLTFINPAGASMLGYSTEEMIGERVHSLIHHTKADGADYPVEECLMYQSFTEGVTGTRDDEVLWHKDGSSFPVLYNSVPVRNDEEELVGSVIVFHDITERKKAAEELQIAKEKAEEATKAKSDFLANMSHEIRTPMNAIIGMSYLALKTDLDKKQRNYIEKVHRSGDSLLGIINDILDFSKIEAGKMDMESIDFRMEDVMDNLANLVGLKAEEKGVELLFDTAADVPMALIGDPLRVGQILVNLGNNAVKFTDEGQIVVSMRVKEISDESVTLHFMVRDSGIGMTPEQVDKLFQAFSQADSSTSRKYGGTGLGLTISKRLAEMMGGKIWVESEAGKGSAFQFTATFGRTPGEWSGRVKPTLPELDGLRVLAVDDNATAREILVDILKSFDFEVESVASGKLALELLESSAKPFDVILMDWMMPKMDGVETTRQIQQRLDSPPPVIMVTAYGREEAHEASEGVVFAGILSKPVTPSSLLDGIMEALGHELERVDHRGSEDESEATNKLRGARVLLVEDNEINQELAMELLTTNGIIVEVANNGQEALDMLDKALFDGVLMDCQMPVMDGYEATQKIRQQESFKDLPVLAMTANAMAGDREKVIEAGMNDHIAKPINVRDMFATMAKWITPFNPVAESEVVVEKEEVASEGIPELPGIDTKAGMATTQGNTKLYRKLLTKFRDAEAGFAEQFRAALSDDDPIAPERTAHTLKGVAGNIGAKAVQEAAKELEAACKEKREAEEIDRLLKAVNAELSPVLAGLAEIDKSENKVGKGTESLDVEQFSLLLDKLRPLLEDDDTAASEVLDEVLELPGMEAHRSVLKELSKAIDEYDFEEALAVLEKMVQNVNVVIE